MIRALTFVACIALLRPSAGLAQNGEPQPEPTMMQKTPAERAGQLWSRCTGLAAVHKQGLAELPAYLDSLEPGAFDRRYGLLGPQTRVGDKQLRIRAIRAVAALQDLAGVPHLVAAVGCDDADIRRESLRVLADWVYDDYYAGGNRRRNAKLQPLLAVFVERLIIAGDDEPTISAACFQAIGCLADADWLTVLAELSESPHPAVAHWNAWAAKEIVRRSNAQTSVQASDSPDGKVK